VGVKKQRNASSIGGGRRSIAKERGRGRASGRGKSGTTRGGLAKLFGL
jgi:hypothetical protein